MVNRDAGESGCMMDAPFAIDGLEAMTVAETLRDDTAEIDWLEKRSGKVTGSNFGAIYGKGRNAAFTQTGITYLNGVIAERLGASLPSIGGASLSWGTEKEPQALEQYRHANPKANVVVEPFQFIDYTPFSGATPDGLVDWDGCLEVKCPHNPGVHVATMLSGKVPAKYIWQVYGHLLVTGREWCDFVSYDPRSERPLFVIRVERDADMLLSLRERLKRAVTYVKIGVAKLEGSA